MSVAGGNGPLEVATARSLVRPEWVPCSEVIVALMTRPLGESKSTTLPIDGTK